MMKGMFAVVAFTLVTAVCWGVYGPVIQAGQFDMGGSRLRPFVCVGIAYFAIAVVTPLLLLQVKGEIGNWTTSGVLWSFLAGAAGAVGALGIILAFSFHGRPLYVMPLVFGGAPVVNTFVTMFFGGTLKQIKPLFLAGLIVVVLGAATVLIFKPAPHVVPGAAAPVSMSLSDMFAVIFFIVMTALCWGSYGPLLHKGQQAMNGSRLRPFTCVGMAYFVVAVLFPLLLMGAMEPENSFTFWGSFWSLIGGATGAIGAMGLIMAFTAGGKPVYIMPLVFGAAPVINSLTEIIRAGSFSEINPLFYAGLILVIGGAVMVLVFAPRGQPHAVTSN